MQELSHRVCEAIRIVLMNHVPTVKRHEMSIGASRCHLLELVLCRNPALATPDQESRASTREPISPMVAIQA